MALELRCEDLGLACKDRITGGTREELLEKVAAHARGAHQVELNDTLVDYALTKVRST